MTHLQFNNSYATLPDHFFARQAPVPVASPELIRVNAGLAWELGIDPGWLASPEGVAVLAGNAVPAGAAPLAMAYAGHQFGGFSPQLGDGRALLLGEVIGRDGVRRDIHLKGAGRTAFSRGGDGRAALGPVLREFVLCEAMYALGIPSTRALAAVTTGEAVRRDTVLPGAIFARVAQSHVRIGTFEFFRARGDLDAMRTLAEYVIARHYPAAAQADNPYRALLDAVIGRTATLVAKWLNVGFIHGVMNTDNMSIAGETIDYGPCAFMDQYHPATVYSSIDHGGRYAYGNQPSIAHWNLARLAESLLPLLDADKDAAMQSAYQALDAFPALHQTAYLDGLRAKLGFSKAHDGDRALAEDLLARMAAQQADFTLTFRHLSEAAAAGDTASVRAQFTDPAIFDSWATEWRARLALEGGPSQARAATMRAVNPAFIPRNHRVQAAIDAAQESGDFTTFDELMLVLSRPYDPQPDFTHYAAPPQPDEVVHQTFCGT